MLQSPFAACVFAILAAASSIAHAQGFGNSGSSAFGSSFGSSSFGSGGFGSSSFGQSGLGGGGIGMGGMGGGGMGSGMGGLGNSGLGGMGSGSSTFGNQGIGAGGQSFVGRDSSDMASTFNQMGQAGAQFFNQMNRGMARNNSSSDSAPTIENPPQVMRVNLQVAFTARRPSPAELTSTIRTRLGRILAEQSIVAPQITMEGDIAVLGGVAATESQRLVLEKLIAMEPGVGAVRNEMTVIPPTATE